MNRRVQGRVYGRGRRICTIVAFMACSALGGLASASPLPPEDEVPEMMMEAQGTYAIYLATKYGMLDLLSFTSNVDLTARSYSFALLPGSTYGGQLATLSASGAHNSGTDHWDFAASGTIGPDTWSATGEGIDPNGFWGFDTHWDPFDEYTVISNVSYTFTATATVSEGTFTVKKGILEEVVSTSTHTDRLILQGPDKGKWIWDDGSFHTGFGDRRADASGFTPDGGGVGSFTTAITVPVPEPAGIASLCAASSALLATARRKKR